MQKILLRIAAIALLALPIKSIAQSKKDSVALQDTTVLPEVVITGTGIPVNKNNTAIAVHSIKVNNKIKPPSADIGQFLIGKIPGAQISSTNGSPGAPVNILLRGVNTVIGTTKPMILIDGLEVKATALQTLDINTIDHAEVVEGAAAASLYGAQGANGVIQLFTKKGLPGKITIDLSSSITSTQLLNTGNVHQSKFHAFTTNSNNEVIDGSGNVITFSPVTNDYSANAQYNALSPTSYADKTYDKNFLYHDLYKQFLQKGYIINNAITISGSKEKIDFYLTLSNNKQNSNFKGNGDYSRSNLTSNLGIEIIKNLQLRSLTQLSYTKNTLNDPTGRNILFGLNNTRPFADYSLKDNDGNYGYYYGDVAGLIAQNPNYINQYSSQLNNTIDVLQNLNLSYTFPRFVELDIKYGINFQQVNMEKRFENQEFNKNAANQQYWIGNYNPNNSAATTGEIDNINDRTTFQHFIATAIIKTNFKKDFKSAIPLTTSTQLAFDYRKNNYKHSLTYGYDAPDFSPWNASQASVYKIAADYTEPFITYGFLLNQRFDYKEMAGFSIGVRSDLSSAFGSGATAQTFPRSDGYINLSKLNWWQHGKILNVLPLVKIRGSFGSAGIQPGAYQRFPILGTSNLGGNSRFIFPSQTPNKNLTVEISKETELGIDMRFTISKKEWFKNGSFSFTRWNKKTSNAIYYVDNAPTTGIGTFLDNAFGLKSNGYEASLDLNILTAKNIQWNFTTLFSKQQSIIASIKGNEIIVPTSAGTSNYVLRAGEKIGQLYGYLILKDVNQLDPNTGLPFIAANQQSNYEVASNGYVVNKTTKQPFASSSQYALGDANPTFNMSFIHMITYKKTLTFNMQWDWIYGSHLYNQTKSWMYRDGISSDYAIPITITNSAGIKETHAYTAFYRGVYGAGINNGTKDYFNENASFLRLRNISLALDITSLIKISQFNKFQFFISGTNLITLTKYSGMDPEISSGTTNSAFDRGVDHNTISNAKTFSAGFNITY